MSGAVQIWRSWSVTGPWDADKRRSSAGADERHIPSPRATLVSAGRQRRSAPARSSTSRMCAALALLSSDEVWVFEGLFQGLGGGWVGGLAAHVDVLGDGDFGLA